MPHVEQSTLHNQAPNGKMASEGNNNITTNGERPRSQFISHLASYPVVSDTVTTYKRHPYGAKSLSFISTAYTNIAAPFVQYMRGPVSFVAPYLAKADSMGDSTLSTLESKFPIVKADTATVKEKVVVVAGGPLRLAGQGRDYVYRTYEEELKRACSHSSSSGGANGSAVGKNSDAERTLYRQARALIATEIVLAQAVLAFVVEMVRIGRAQVGERVNHFGEKRNADISVS